MNPPALAWMMIFSGVLIWSGINPKDYFTWLLEVLPALIALIVICATRQQFPLTPLVYILILTHCIVLMVGGHYTYAEVPLFDNLFGMERNNYDKLGHVAQGFVPAIVAREILIRFEVVDGRHWRNLFIVSFCLGFSAFYELIEWGVAALTGEDAQAFLGTQGFVWDTQSDMAFALVGAITALVLLTAMHDQQLRALSEQEPSANKSPQRTRALSKKEPSANRSPQRTGALSK